MDLSHGAAHTTAHRAAARAHTHAIRTHTHTHRHTTHPTRACRESHTERNCARTQSQPRVFFCVWTMRQHPVATRHRCAGTNVLTRGRQHAENGLLHNTHVTQCGMRMGSEGLVRGSHSGQSPARSRVAREQQRKAASCCATADGLLKTAAVIAPSWQPPSSAQFRILRPHPSSARR